MSSDSNTISPSFLKGAFSFLIAGAADRYVMGYTDIKRNAMFATTTAVGITVGSLIGAQIPSAFEVQDGGYYTGKGVAQRSFEIMFAGGASYGSFYASGYEFNKADMTKRLGTIIAIDVLTEYFSDYLLSQPLNAFA